MSTPALAILTYSYQADLAHQLKLSFLNSVNIFIRPRNSGTAPRSWRLRPVGSNACFILAPPAVWARSFFIAKELHGILEWPLRARAQIRPIAQHLAQRHIRPDYQGTPT